MNLFACKTIGKYFLPKNTCKGDVRKETFHCSCLYLFKFVKKRHLNWPVLFPDTDEKKRLAELDEEVTLSLVDRSYVVKNKKFRAIRLISLLYDNELEKTQSHSNLGVYDLCDLDLDMGNVDQTG